MIGRILSIAGIVGIIVTILVVVASFPSSSIWNIPFAVIGVLIGIVIIVLGEIHNFLEENKVSSKNKEKEEKVDDTQKKN